MAKRRHGPPVGTRAKVGEGPACMTCLHGRRREIDHALATGGTVRNVAERFGLSASSVHRHKKHIETPGPKALRAITAEANFDTETRSATANAILGRIRDADRVLSGAEDDRDWGSMVRALSEVRAIWMDVAKLTGELRSDPTVIIQQIVADPDWRARLGAFATGVQALMARPEAQAIAPELEALVRALAGEAPSIAARVERP